MSDLNTPQNEPAVSGAEPATETHQLADGTLAPSNLTRPDRPWPLLFWMGAVVVGGGLLVWLAMTLLDTGKLVPVTGQVFWGGRPVTDGFVMCIQEGRNVPALSALAPDGKFDLMTNGVPGAMTGAQKVVVQVFSKDIPPKLIIPPKYGHESTTPLKIVVKSSGENHFELNLEGERTD